MPFQSFFEDLSEEFTIIDCRNRKERFCDRVSQGSHNLLSIYSIYCMCIEFPQNTWQQQDNRSNESPPVDPGTLEFRNGQAYCHRSSLAKLQPLSQAQQQPFQQGFPVANGKEFVILFLASSILFKVLIILNTLHERDWG